MPGAGSTREPERSSRLRGGVAWLAVAAWLALIWWLGSGSFGAPATSRILEPLLRWLLPDWPPVERLELAMAIRKLAHPIVYGVLAALTWRAARLSGIGQPLRAAALAFALALATAVLDEVRQAHLPGRTGSGFDVGLDAAGAAVALGLAFVATRLGARPRAELESS